MIVFGQQHGVRRGNLRSEDLQHIYRRAEVDQQVSSDVSESPKINPLCLDTSWTCIVLHLCECKEYPGIWTK